MRTAAFLISVGLVMPSFANDAALNELFKKYLDEEFRRHPTFASEQGFHDYDDRMDDLSPAARAKDRELLAGWKKTLDSFDTSQLSPSAAIDFKIWKHEIESRIALDEMGLDSFEFDPKRFGRYISDSVYVILTQSTLPKERNIANAARRIAQIPKVVAAAMNREDKKLLSRCPQLYTEIAIKWNLGAIAFYEKDIFTLTGENPATSPLAAPCREAIAALKEYQKFLENDLLPRSRGEWRIGREKFNRKFAYDLDAGITADEVIRIADAEADRVEREMYYVAKQLWSKLFPGITLPPDDAVGRRDTVAKVLEKLSETHSQPDQLVADARKSVDRIKTFIRDKKILTLPEPDNCKIIEMPEFQRGFSVAYLNPAPTFDAKASSIYAIAPPPSDWPVQRQTALLREYNTYMLQILTIHEAYPGHYVQLEYANRHPSLVRKVFSNGVFAEGWAVYTEQMMLDQGYGDGDLALRLHQLKFYIRAVLNSILDYRMHCENMTDEEAMKLLVGRGFQTEGEAFGKVQRSKQSSCQLSTYFVGRNAFYNLRAKVQRKEGEKFDLARYHEKVMLEGSIPVKYLPELLGVP